MHKMTRKETMFHIQTLAMVLLIAVGFSTPLVIIIAMMGHQ